MSEVSSIFTKKVQKRELVISLRKNIVHNQYFFQTLINMFISLNILILIYLLVKNFIPTTAGDLFGTMTEKHILMFMLLFLSESFLGVLPPDFFIMWTLECGDCILYLTTIAVLSYFGGMIAYHVGKLIRRYPLVKEFLRKKMIRYSDRIDRWGGIVILLAALTPIPFSPVSMLAGSLNYPFNKYVVFASARIIRFFVYALIFWLLA